MFLSPPTGCPTGLSVFLLLWPGALWPTRGSVVWSSTSPVSMLKCPCMEPQISPVDCTGILCGNLPPSVCVCVFVCVSLCERENGWVNTRNMVKRFVYKHYINAAIYHFYNLNTRLVIKSSSQRSTIHTGVHPEYKSYLARGRERFGAFTSVDVGRRCWEGSPWPHGKILLTSNSDPSPQIVFSYELPGFELQ